MATLDFITNIYNNLEDKLKVKIALLAHYGGNIGHEFMAEGMKNILNKYFQGKDYEIDIYEQHQPFSILNNKLSKLMSFFRPGRGNLLKKVLLSPKIYNYILKKHTQNILKYDMAIAVGGPNIVNNVGNSIDMQLLQHFMNDVFKYNNIPILNISNGSCFPLANIPNELNEKDKFFWEKALKSSDEITVRDKVAYDLLKNSIGYEPKLISCPAIYSAINFEKYGEKSEECIVINYLLKGANEDWGQNVDTDKWKNTIEEFVKYLQKTYTYKIVFICHNAGEVKIAKALQLENYDIVYPKNEEEYAKVVLKSKVALVSRIHAAIPFASVGVPSIVIGADTRLGTVQNIGLETHFVNNISLEILIERFELLIENIDEHKETLRKSKEKAFNDYSDLLDRYFMGDKNEK